MATELIAHRVNTLAELEKLPTEYGVELDLRDCGDRIFLQHDPFSDGENFDDYLRNYSHGTMILNVKSERIEHRVLELLQAHGIQQYFFLDSSFPMIELLSREGESNVALRFSEYEGMDTILNMKDRVDWVWVDCFTKLPLDRESFGVLKDAGFKLCLVSPCLWGRHEEIEQYRKQMAEEEIVFDAICTKSYNFHRWQ